MLKITNYVNFSGKTYILAIFQKSNRLNTEISIRQKDKYSIMRIEKFQLFLFSTNFFNENIKENIIQTNFFAQIIYITLA